MGRFLYKLTDEKGNTRDNTHWDIGTKHEIAKELRDSTKPLCSPSYIHAYENPLIAVFMNPGHADFKSSILWKATGWVSRRDQLKCGCFSLQIVEKLPLPVLSITQKVRISIYCALSVYTSPDFVTWATNWLNGTNRTCPATYVAKAAATYAAKAATAAAFDASYASFDAPYATYAASYAAYTATRAAYAATHAAYTASYAASAVSIYAAATANATAAAAATMPKNSFDLLKIIKRVMKEEENAQIPTR